MLLSNGESLTSSFTFKKCAFIQIYFKKTFFGYSLKMILLIPYLTDIRMLLRFSDIDIEQFSKLFNDAEKMTNVENFTNILPIILDAIYYILHNNVA